jgi:hypothetical protein
MATLSASRILMTMSPCPLSVYQNPAAKSNMLE